jgi:hypothetical protein
MSKPVNENLKSIRIESDDGDLVPMLDFAGDKFSELVRAVVDTNKAGTITMKISIKPSTAGALAAKAEVSMKKPKGLPAEALLWPTPEGNLLEDDPRQVKLPLVSVEVPNKELKTIAA